MLKTQIVVIQDKETNFITLYFYSQGLPGKLIFTDEFSKELFHRHDLTALQVVHMALTEINGTPFTVTDDISKVDSKFTVDLFDEYFIRVDKTQMPFEGYNGYLRPMFTVMFMKDDIMDLSKIKWIKVIDTNLIKGMTL